MGNQFRGNYQEDSDIAMRCYDLLPPEIREFMRNAMHGFASAPRLGMLRAGKTVAELHDELIQIDVKASRRDALADWRGQSADYLAAQRPRRRRDWLDKPVNTRL